ncbi:MAG: SOS response-associated peptidase family protein [Hyphomicrobiaceae bacterium]
MTTNHEAVIRLFKVGHNRAEPIEAQSAIFPGGTAPIVRRADDGERELLNMSWGFVLLMKGLAPKRVTNFRDDKLTSSFWAASIRERRCLVPVSSFSEPKGQKPAIWHWFALSDKREPFSFAGIWRSYKGPIRKDGDLVEIETFSFMTTKPNELVATIHPSRMPVMLVGEEAQSQWLEGNQDDALSLVLSYPADRMAIVQAGEEKKDLLQVA